MAMDMTFVSRHNICAYLETTHKNAQPYLEMLRFLRRSRISYALTANPYICEDHIRQFWSTAAYRCDLTPPAIVATVADMEVQVSEDLVRSVLRFGDDPTDRNEFPYTLIRGFFEQRLHYIGLFSDTQLRKQYVSSQWRLLMHVLIHCISSRKGGFDGIGLSLQSAMVALVLNKPYNFTRYIFKAMISNVQAGDKRYIMYPRFIQLFLNTLLPNLQPTSRRFRLSNMDIRIFKDCNNYKQQPPIVAPFGHVAVDNYVEPPNDEWMHPIYPPQAQEEEIEEEEEKPLHRAPRGARRERSPPPTSRDQAEPSARVAKRARVAPQVQEPKPENPLSPPPATQPGSSSLPRTNETADPSTFAELKTLVLTLSGQVAKLQRTVQKQTKALRAQATHISKQDAKINSQHERLRSMALAMRELKRTTYQRKGKEG